MELVSTPTEVSIRRRLHEKERRWDLRGLDPGALEITSLTLSAIVMRLASKNRMTYTRTITLLTDARNDTVLEFQISGWRSVFGS
ncbi:hypothetical protein G5I_02923 [Acromyrmex echinatior]|uniref:Uncharacterized protein n=1 Tax=Acromyrmex echinatior TaxID=103372 RepID=F4WBK6_ACREC|nr:hypothetical protein G5I_02923 [Acromyrmex echinatior]